MSKLDKRRKGVYGPPLGKKFIIFVDDINLPAMDPVGSKGAIEVIFIIVSRKCASVVIRLAFAYFTCFLYEINL